VLFQVCDELRPALEKRYSKELIDVLADMLKLDAAERISSDTARIRFAAIWEKSDRSKEGSSHACVWSSLSLPQV
jgi:hypothetical protein